MEANKILNLMFEMKINTHIAHLQTDKYSHHKILQKFYEEIEDILDEFAEHYQGISGKRISSVGNIQVKEGVKIDTYLKDCKEKMDSFKESDESGMCGGTIGDVSKLIQKTLYLLTLD